MEKTSVAIVKHRCGCKRQKPDARDVRYEVGLKAGAPLPESCDLRARYSIAAYDQGKLGSCTANGIAYAYQAACIKSKQTPTSVSRLFLYYKERQLEGSVDEDNGADLRSGFKVMHRSGSCAESFWPYSIERFATRPPRDAEADAQNHVVITYRAIDQNELALKSVLYSGIPIVFGFETRESFDTEETRRSGVMSVPAPNEAETGGHCVVLVGYNDKTRMFIVRNSWGKDWGDHGYFQMPYALVLDAKTSYDFWVMTTVQETSRTAPRNTHESALEERMDSLAKMLAELKMIMEQYVVRPKERVSSDAVRAQDPRPAKPVEKKKIYRATPKNTSHKKIY